MPLDRNAILQVDDRQLVTLTIPEWGGEVCIRPMSGTERDSFESEMVGKEAAGRLVNIRARMAVRVLCDADGKRLFTDADAELIGRTKSASSLDRIFDVAGKQSRIGNEGVAAAGKPSASSQSDASGSGSPSPSDTAASETPKPA